MSEAEKDPILELFSHLQGTGLALARMARKYLSESKDSAFNLDRLAASVTDWLFPGDRSRGDAYTDVLEALRRERESLEKKKDDRSREKAEILQELEKALEKRRRAARDRRSR